MNEQTFTRKLERLLIDINNHTHKDEILNIMAEQVADDTEIVHYS
jgi:hypothetical protein